MTEQDIKDLELKAVAAILRCQELGNVDLSSDPKERGIQTCRYALAHLEETMAVMAVGKAWGIV